MTASDYPVEFGFHGQDGTFYGPNGSVGLYHLGVDRYTPTGTPVVIGGIEIGKTGATGRVGGPHLHIQAWKDGDNVRNAIDPAPYEFKPGTVTTVASSSDFGNYIILNVDGTNVAYCHLSVQEANVGQLIGEDMGIIATDKQIDDTINELRILAGVPDNQLDALLADQRPLFKNNYVEATLTVLDNYAKAKPAPPSPDPVITVTPAPVVEPPVITVTPVPAPVEPASVIEKENNSLLKRLLAFFSIK